ncbi:integrase catalytic domain-containing protein [Trichonephila clavipes]|nr:integrase catalytic domain-containing protein [Trichonephila clavipes]
MKAIPPDLALEYNKKHNETQSQITDFIAYLRSEVESRERTEFLVKPHDLELKNNNSYSNTKYFERTSHSYPQSNRRVQGHSRFHPSHKSFSSANELLTAAFPNCLFCFENTHMSDLCRHARAICFKLEKSKQNSHLDLEEKNVDVKTTSSNSVFHNRGGVLLQCVKAEIIGRSSSDKIFCLFDNGSSDFYWSLTHRIKRLDSSLVAVETRLGWSLQGKCDELSDCTLGEFDKSVNFVDGRYGVNLPWKPGMREALQNNKTVARKRFEGMVRRFKCDHELFCEYKDVIDDYVREGIVERTSCDSLLDSQGFYLPHHAVIHSDKTTSRIRIVFDGSAHENGQSSLNQSLYTGPNLHPNILELLLCFRKSPVAFTADQQEGVKTESSETSAIDLRPPTKVLGLAWDPENDLIYFDPKDLLKFMSRRGESKRFFLSVVGRIFDPIGILGPFVIKLKCLLQEIWTLGVEWDSELLPKLRHKWQQWSSEAEGLTEIKIPRFYLGNIDQEISKCEKHCFSDASKSAYGRILYLRFVTCNNEVETSFICSKSRVAPLKSLTLSRLELTAAERELAYFANILKDSEFQNFVADKGIHWKFIVERVPWWGGFYERLVKTINDPLRKILGRALLTFEEFSTILSEVEVIVNHRPLTYVENDLGEPEPLTPAHFLELGYGDSKYPIHFIELIDATTAKESYKKRDLPNSSFKTTLETLERTVFAPVKNS